MTISYFDVLSTQTTYDAISISAFTISTAAFGQKNDSLTGPVNIVDGVYIPAYEPCMYDSIARLHNKATFVIADSSTYNYTFQPGTKTYLELSIRTTKCRCSDCQSFNHLIIDLSELPDSGEMAVSPENLTWITWNSWIMPKTERFIDGALTLKGDAISLKIFSFYDELQRAIWNELEMEMQLTK
jgi:hypothetical protein